MADYSLNPVQKANAATLLIRMKEKGITNPNSQAGILSIVSKESAFMPVNETSYKNTSNERIRAIFGSRVKDLSEAELTSLKKDDKAFYDQVYGYKYPKLGLGNDQPGDGYKYRGRGFNGITGKALYKKFGDRIGVDLVKNPEKANDISVASDILIEYFKDSINALSKLGKLSAYNSTGINDFKSISDAVGAFYHANAGIGMSVSAVQADPTGGRKKAFDRSAYFLKLVKDNPELSASNPVFF